MARSASPLIANIARSVLDEHFCAKWDSHGADWRRAAHSKRGGATYKIVRYADVPVPVVGVGSQALPVRASRRTVSSEPAWIRC